MSDVFNISDLRQQYSDKMQKKELQDFAEAQNKALLKAAQKIQELEEKNAHLENLLMQKASSNSEGLGLMAITPEEAICMQQIRILEQKSMVRELTPEETRKFDIFVKNLRLIREGNTVTIKSENLDEVSEEKLIEIARGQNS